MELHRETALLPFCPPLFPTPSWRACVLTPTGRGAIAVIRVEGNLLLLEIPPPLFAAANGRPLRDQSPNRVVYGRWGTDPVEEVVVTRLDEETLEVHCHGGRAAVERVLADLQSRGAIVETWDEFFSRTKSFVDAECLRVLTRSTTRRTATILAEQQSGLLRDALVRIRNAPSAAEQLRRIDEMLSWSEFGRHLTEPWSVVVCGRPNVGKSSLINALAGFARSIVYDQPGTTRDVVTVETAFEGWPVVLSDTAGLRETSDGIESEGVARARRRLAEADLKVLVLDGSVGLSDDDRRLLAEHPDALVVAHKADLPTFDRSLLPADAISVSSLAGTGMPALIERIVNRLVPKVPEGSCAIPVSAPLSSRLVGIRDALLRDEAEVADTWLETLLRRPAERFSSSADDEPPSGFADA